MSKQHALFYAAIALAAAFTGCSRDGGVSLPPDAVAVVGGDVLTGRDLRQNVPAGLSVDDSTKLAKAYIRSWIDRKLLLRVASSQIDMAEIDRLVEEYRSELIAGAYRRSMASRADSGVLPQDSLLAYYDKHKSEFVLERPLVKGVYLKVPDDAANLRELRRLYRSDRDTDKDRLEKAAAGSAIHYDYFRDRWVDWEQIETRIPTGATENPASFLKSGKNIDVQSGGFVYLLAVTDYLAAGSPMPFEAAMPIIRERLLSRERRRLDTQLRRDLYEQSVADGTVRFPSGTVL